jgi:hypothetical protein
MRRAALYGELEPRFISAEVGDIKTAGDLSAVNKLAEQYCLYKLAFLQAIPETEFPLTAAMLIMQNYVA